MTTSLVNPQEFQDLLNYSAPKARILQAALELFVKHGIAGTSLQMIADHIGVTKAAVYHQFNTKEEIILAAVGLIFEQIGQIIQQAEAEPSATQARHTLVEGLITIAIAGRRVAGFLHQDPVLIDYYQQHKPFSTVMQRMDELLLGDNRNAESKVTAALLITAIGGAVMHPLVDDVDDITLRKQLDSFSQLLLTRLD